jgi:hypothetical protein
MSRFMKMFTATATVALVLIASIQAPTLAFTVDESVIASGGDASDVYTLAPDVTNTIDAQTVINGSVLYSGNPPAPGGFGTTPNNVADVYKISLSSGDFQVKVDGGFTAILALFNSEGKGVYISDSPDSKIFVNIDQAGVYYLGISVNTRVRTSGTFSPIAVPSTLENGGENIFPASYYNNNLTTPQPLQPPTSLVQGGYRFDGTSFPFTGDSYVATLTGTAVNVPEPATAGTGFGFLALALTTGIGRRLRLTEKSGFKN